MPFYLLIAVLVFAPLAYGTTGPVAITIVQALVLFGLVWVAVQAALGRRQLYRPPALLPLTLLGLLMVLQMVPLSPSLLRLISPATWQRYADTVWLLQPDAWMPLTVNLQRTFESLLTFLSCCAAYLLACQVFASPRLQGRTVRLLAVFAGGFALLSILESLVPNGRVLWLLREWPVYAGGERFGSYVNGNHYAGLMGMLLPLLIALFLAEKPAVRFGTWREQLTDFFTDPQLNDHLLAGAAALLTAVSIFLSLSRGGILSTLGALIIFGLLLLWQGYERRRALILLLFLGFLFFAVGIFGWQPIFDAFARLRNLQGEIHDGRLDYWRDSLAMMRDFPLFGSGFGSFIDSYAGYQHVYQGVRVVDYAHNEYVELVTDAGLSGALLALWAMLALLRGTWSAFRQRSRSSSLLLYLGCLAGLAAMLLHNLTEFNLHIAANAHYFAVLCGLLVSAATTSGQRGGRSELPVFSGNRVRLLTVASLCLLLGGGLFNVAGLMAGARLAPLTSVPPVALDEAGRLDLLQRSRLAKVWAPLDATYPHAEARALELLGQPEAALAAYGWALHLRPLHAFTLQKAADAAASLGRRELQGALLKAGVTMDRADLRPLKPYLTWLMEERRETETFALVRRALTMAPQETRNLLQHLTLSGLSLPDLQEGLPERAQPWQIYAEYLDEYGVETFAEDAYRHAVRLVADEPRPEIGPYLAFSRFLQKRKRFVEALYLLSDGLNTFPGNASLHASIGVLLEQQGMIERAAEAYRQALLLNPRLTWVRERLGRISF